MGWHADFSQRIGEPKLGKFAHRRRLQIDAHSNWSRLTHRLVNTDRDAGLMQAERKAQPADAAPGNDDFDVLHFAATRGSLTLLKVTNSTLRSSPSSFSTLRI